MLHDADKGTLPKLVLGNFYLSSRWGLVLDGNTNGMVETEFWLFLMYASDAPDVSCGLGRQWAWNCYLPSLREVKVQLFYFIIFFLFFLFCYFVIFSPLILCFYFYFYFYFFVVFYCLCTVSEILNILLFRLLDFMAMGKRYDPWCQR